MPRWKRLTPRQQPFGEVIARLARRAVDAQRQLDDHHERDVAQFAEAVVAAGLPPDHELVRAIRPSRLQLARQRIEVRLTETVRRSVEFDVGLRIGLRTVTSFLEARSSAVRRSTARLTIHVAAAPVTRAASKAPAKKENDE